MKREPNEPENWIDQIDWFGSIIWILRFRKWKTELSAFTRRASLNPASFFFLPNRREPNRYKGIAVAETIGSGSVVNLGTRVIQPDEELGEKEGVETGEKGFSSLRIHGDRSEL